MFKWFFIFANIVFGQKEFVGVWEGFQFDGKENLRLIFVINENQNIFSASLDNLNSGYKGIPLRLSFKNGKISLELNSGIPFVYSGRITSKKDSIYGEISGKGWKDNLNLKRLLRRPEIEKPEYEISKDDLSFPLLERSKWVLNEKKLTQLISKVNSVENVYSFSIYQNGKVVTENFFNNTQQHHKTNIKSVSKSILSLLTGIAIEQGFLNSVNEPIYRYMREDFKHIKDSVKYGIRIKNLLTMTSGFDYSENTLPEPVFSSGDWIKSTLNLPMRSKPGEHGIYSTPNTHLLGYIISKVTKMSLLEFADKYLFEPLGIKDVSWSKDPQGNYFGGSEVFMTPRQLAQIGMLILNKGKYNGKQIMTKRWIDKSTQNQLFVEEKITWLDKEGYGYLWYPETIQGAQTISAKGFGGQHIIIFPERKLVIVTTANEKEFVKEYSRRQTLFSFSTKGIINCFIN